MKTIGNIIKYTIAVASIAFLLWVTISWVDVVSDNLSPNPQHADWNIFSMMVEEVA